MKRRSFFRSLATLVATVALAPEIAFNRRLELPKTGFNPTTDGIYNQIHNCHMDGTPVGLDLQNLLDELWTIKRKRASGDTIEIWLDNKALDNVRRMA